MNLNTTPFHMDVQKRRKNQRKNSGGQTETSQYNAGSVGAETTTTEIKRKRQKFLGAKMGSD